MSWSYRPNNLGLSFTQSVALGYYESDHRSEKLFLLRTVAILAKKDVGNPKSKIAGWGTKPKRKDISQPYPGSFPAYDNIPILGKYVLLLDFGIKVYRFVLRHLGLLHCRNRFS